MNNTELLYMTHKKTIEWEFFNFERFIQGDIVLCIELTIPENQHRTSIKIMHTYLDVIYHKS